MDLYKKYRPRVWADVIGQDESVKPIKDYISRGENRSYLLSGQYGSGKTTVAFLIAKSLNCLNFDTESGEPCNKCDVCINIDAGVQDGVEYIPASENGGVDRVREMLNRSERASIVRNKVFIIDEAHSLSKTAVEALLIPLERENSNVTFILCTTESDKIPKTISSRMVSLSFPPIPEKKLWKRLLEISKKESIKITSEELKEIVLSSDGSMRNALANLDRFSAGMSFESHRKAIFRSFGSLNMYEVIRIAGKSMEAGFQPRSIVSELGQDLMKLLLASKGQKIDSPPCSSDEAKKFFSNLKGEKGLIYSISELSSCMKDAQFLSASEVHFLFSATVLKILGTLSESTEDSSDPWEE